MPDFPDVSAATETLVTALAEGAYEYALVGGLAVVLQGHDRYTRDVDVLVWDLDERLDSLTALLASRGFREATPGQFRKARSARILHLLAADGTAVDILMGFLPFEREVIDHSVTMPLLAGRDARVGSPEDLIIMKLIASRRRDLSDVAALLELYPSVDRSRIRRIVEQYAEVLESQDILKHLNDMI